MVENEETTEDVQMNDLSDKESRTWGMACHLAGLAMFVIPYLGNILGPLIVWIMKRSEYPFVDEQGKEALNFQISMTIYKIVATILITFAVGCFLLPAVVIADVALLIVAATKANKGESYRYPITIRFIK
jgi:uncharacterized Tic20 family protein